MATTITTSRIEHRYNDTNDFDVPQDLGRIRRLFIRNGNTSNRKFADYNRRRSEYLLEVKRRKGRGTHAAEFPHRDPIGNNYRGFR